MRRRVVTSMPLRPVTDSGPDVPAEPRSHERDDALPAVARTLSPEEVADLLGTSPWWLREQARRGSITHLRLGKGRIRFLPEHVSELLSRCTVQKNTTTDEEESDDTGAAIMALGGTRRSQRAHRR